MHAFIYCFFLIQAQHTAQSLTFLSSIFKRIIVILNQCMGLMYFFSIINKDSFTQLFRQIQQQNRLLLFFNIKMQQAEIIFQNLFIVNPNKRSSYKIRIMINHQFSQENFENDAPTVQVKIKINPSSLSEQAFGYILLLQRTNTVGNGRRYLQIGKGEIDFNDLLTENANRFSELKGAIYGTRAYNYDKVIAKYRYMMAKGEVQIAKNYQMNEKDNKNESVVKKVTFKNHKRIDRLPILKMQSSIADKSFSIDQKFKILNQSLKKLRQEKNEQKEGKNGNLTPEKRVQLNKVMNQLSPKKSLLDSQILQMTDISNEISSYIYRLSDRAQKCLQTDNCDSLRFIKIKNIKIIDLSNEKNDQSAQQPLKINKSMLILIRIYQKSFYSHLRSRILQIVVQVALNSNNQTLNTYFPVQIISDVLMIQIFFTKKSNKPPLFGQIHSTNNVYKIIELFNKKREQRGFILLQNTKNKKPIFENTNYKIQLKKFIKVLPIFDINQYNHNFNTQLSLSRIQPELTTNITLAQSESNKKRQQIATLSYSQRSQEYDEKAKRIKKYSLRTSQNRNSSVLVHSLSGVKIMLEIKNIYLNIYELPQKHNFFLKNSCKFTQSQYRRISKGYNSFQSPSNPFLIEILNRQSIKLACFQQQNKQFLGSATINTSQLLRTQQKQLKLFLKKKKTITGYLNIQLDCYKINQSKLQKLKREKISLPSKIQLPEQYEIDVPSSRIVTIKRPRQRVFNHISRSLPLDKDQLR